MAEYKRSEVQQKIIDGMEKVYEKLISFKIKANSDAVVARNGKIVRIKPEELSLLLKKDIH